MQIMNYVKGRFAELEYLIKANSAKITGARFLGTELLWKCIHVTLLALRTLRWIPDFWKICGPLSGTL
jgi:hypothetical protein